MKGVAELIDIELKGVSIARANTYLVVEGQMLIDLTDIIFVGKGVGNSFLKFTLVGTIIEKYGV